MDIIAKIALMPMELAMFMHSDWKLRWYLLLPAADDLSLVLVYQLSLGACHNNQHTVYSLRY